VFLVVRDKEKKIPWSTSILKGQSKQGVDFGVDRGKSTLADKLALLVSSISLVIDEFLGLCSRYLSYALLK